MGQLTDRRLITVTDEPPLDRARPEPRLARGTSREIKIDRDLELHRHFTELRSLVIELVERMVPASQQVRVFVFAPDVVFAWIDPLFVEHVVASLITGALEHSIGTSSIVIRVEERRGSALISITDNALVPSTCAIDDHGMTMNRQIATAHGGSLGIDHIGNEHTRCTLELPLASAEPPRRPRLDGRRGLIVGNALPHADALLAMLAAEGMRTERLDTQHDAMRAIRRNRPDVVVVDANLPGGFGDLRGALPAALIVIVTNTPTTRLRSREPIILVNPIDAGEVFAVVARRLAVPDRAP
jgi:hypothetical protein